MDDEDREVKTFNGVLWVPNPEAEPPATDESDQSICECSPSPQECPKCKKLTSAYVNGYNEGYWQAENDLAPTDKSRNLAARFLYRKDAPPGEAEDAWENVSPERRDIYLRSAEMIAKLWNGQSV